MTCFFALRKLESAVTFHPARYSSNSLWRLPEGAEDVWLTTSDNVLLNGWFVRSKIQPSSATIIYFHGNGGNISDVGWVGKNLASRGFDVLLIDYRGYGRSHGNVDSERELNLDGDAAYDYIVNMRGVRPEKVVLFGQSLGTTVAVDVASRNPCGAVILESGLSSAADMASQVLPWITRYLYVLGKNRFESARKLAKVKSPILIAHGDPDPVIPVEQGRKLYAAANEPKKLLVYPGAGHNVHGVVGEKYLDEVRGFIHNTILKNST
ncbi:MAG TPA: alpha/beta hydrolase [Pyrinomonadaceae bacterium]|jgi:hypothetical protein